MDVSRVLQELRRQVKQQTECPRGCGSCCQGDVLMTYEEWRQVDHADKTKDREEKEPCRFYEDYQCGIYRHRPLPCRWYGLADAGDNHCVGLIREKRLSKEQVEQIRRRWTLLLYRQMGETLTSCKINDDRLAWLRYCLQIPEGQQIKESIQASLMNR
jgi:Fe-S-cluster containining protein